MEDHNGRRLPILLPVHVPAPPLRQKLPILKKDLLAGAMPVNGVLLALHGAVAATFDLHAHVTPP